MQAVLLVSRRTDRAAVRAALEGSGLVVVEAGDRAQAFDRLLRRPPCAAVLVDASLPAQGARALLEWLVRSPMLAGLPVILLIDEAAPYRGPRPTHVVRRDLDGPAFGRAVAAIVRGPAGHGIGVAPPRA